MMRHTSDREERLGAVSCAMLSCTMAEMQRVWRGDDWPLLQATMAISVLWHRMWAPSVEVVDGR